MNKKNMMIMVAVAVVFAAGGFFGGTKYAQAKRTSQLSAFRSGAAGGFPGRGGRGDAAGGGFASGQIIAQDDKSVTIKMTDGSSKIVFLAGSTQIAKSDVGAVTDLASGQQVVVTGTSNSDGSITATGIQIRPANMTPPATK